MLISDIDKRRREQRVHSLKTKMDEISQNMIKRAKSLNTNLMAIRKDHEIFQLWDQLCRYHMEAIVLCTSFSYADRPTVCSMVLRPLGCVEIMHLSEEETWCVHFLKRVGEYHCDDE